MKICSKCSSSKLFSDFWKNSKTKDGLRSQCISCHKLDNQRWKNTNKEHRSEYNKAYYIDNKHKILTKNAIWWEKHPEAHAAKQANRRANKNKATPNWLTKEQKRHIVEYYELSKIMRLEFNQKIEVDHIIPLNGKDVSGLHVPWNLQLMVSSANRQKSNKVICEN